ncbi:ROK family glucokinase [Holzapfeliella sp. He02]|uniref:Glucokinase n=1 Tax=Holzapfeliella saturejae TaxID=3082953 RepID=A0ABU8SGW2_9LACO
MDKKLIGVDLGGTTIKFAILTKNGEIQQRWAEDTNILDDGSHIIPDIIKSINHHLNLYHMKPEQFAGIGMGSPGSVNQKDGSVVGAYNLNWRKPVFPKRDIEEGTGIPVFIDNDANVAALGEKWKGAGDNASNVAFATLGTGVGGGIIVNDQIAHGAAGAAGEIGHIIVERHGYKCTCGNNGCLETVASATGIVRVARDLAEEYAGNSSLKRLLDAGEEISAKIVFDLAKKDDPLAVRVINRICDYLGYALANISNTLNPDFVVIGGGVSAAGDLLLNKTTEAFEESAFPSVRNSTKLRLASLGNEAGVIGAASLIVQ